MTFERDLLTRESEDLLTRLNSLSLDDTLGVIERSSPRWPGRSLVLSSVPCYHCDERTRHATRCPWNIGERP